MKKVLLASTCAAALSIFGAWAVSDASFAQQSTGGGATQQNMGGANDQQKERKAPGAEQKRPGGAMNGATNENREQAPRSNTAQQRENTSPGKEGETNRREPTTAQQKGPAENGAAQSSQTNRPESTHTGQANERERTRSGAAEQNGATRNGAAQNETSKERTQTGENAQQRGAKPTEGRAAAEPQGGAGAATTNAGRNEMGGQSKMRLNASQASDFRSRLEKHGMARASVNFDVRMGAAVPASVRLEPVPEDIIAEYPEFRGYDVVMVQDRIVIVDPRTRDVVEVVGGGTNAASAAGPRRERLRLSREQDEVIRRNVHIEHPSDVEFDEQMDERVPDTITLAPMPEAVIADVPEVRSYDYFVDRGDHVVIVDPETHEVVGIVEQ